jgi:hypothetical protein
MRAARARKRRAEWSSEIGARFLENIIGTVDVGLNGRGAPETALADWRKRKARDEEMRDSADNRGMGRGLIFAAFIFSTSTALYPIRPITIIEFCL